MRGLPVFLLLPSLILAACSHAPSAPVLPVQKPAAPAPAPAATLPRAATTTAPVAPGLSYRPPQPPRQLADGAHVPAVQGLLAASDRALGQHNLDLAAVNLERAQRLAPQSAAVYQKLATVRLRQKRPAEAEQLARKALAYSASAAQQALLWRQIAAARQQLGQTQSALEALARAAALENPDSANTPAGTP